MVKKLFLVIFLTLSTVLLLPSHAMAASVGLVPSDLEVSSLLPGNIYSQSFTITRETPTTDATAKIEFDDSSAADWITVDPGEELALVAGQQTTSFTVTITVPNDVAAGDYQPVMRVTLIESSVNEKVLITPGVRLDAKLTVGGEEIKSLRVVSSEIPNVPIGGTLTLIITIQNDGNIALAPTLIIAEIYDLAGNLVYVYQTNDIEPIDPFSSKDIEILMTDHGLPNGSYLALVKVYDNAVLIYEDELAFSLEGELSEDDDDIPLPNTGDDNQTPVTNALSKLLSNQSINIYTILFCLSGLIVILFIIIFFYRRKYREKKEYE